MQHSYEGLDRAGGFSRVGLLSPLRHRDFRVMWAGMTISLLAALIVVSPQFIRR